MDCPIGVSNRLPLITEATVVGSYDTVNEPDPVQGPASPSFSSTHTEHYDNGTLISFWNGINWINIFVGEEVAHSIAATATTTLDLNEARKWNITIGLDSILAISGSLIDGAAYVIRYKHTSIIHDWDLSILQFASGVTVPNPIVDLWTTLECRALNGNLFCQLAYIETTN